MDGLGGVKVGNIHSLDCWGSMDDGTGHILLNMRGGKASLEDGAHQLLALVSRQGGSHQRVIQSFHDGVIETIPSIVAIDLVGADGVSPFPGFCQKVFELVGLVSVRADH